MLQLFSLHDLKMPSRIFDKVNGYQIIENNNIAIRIERKTGMPLSISQVQLVDLMTNDEPSSTHDTPIFLSYGSEEQNIFVSVLEAYDKTNNRIMREVVGISESGELLRGNILIEVIEVALRYVVGVTMCHRLYCQI